MRYIQSLELSGRGELEACVEYKICYRARLTGSVTKITPDHSESTNETALIIDPTAIAEV
jgi:hypothetical protein